MLLTTAQKLIENGIEKNDLRQTWIDLGAGKGLFTKALASQLATGSLVIGVDKDDVALSSIKIEPQISFQSIVSDFENVSNLPANVDGIVMANSLHYVSAQRKFLDALRSRLKKSGRLILIEYDLNIPNQWVPYPIAKSKMETLLLETGYSSIRFLFETPSLFNSANIYSCVVLK